MGHIFSGSLPPEKNKKEKKRKKTNKQTNNDTVYCIHQMAMINTNLVYLSKMVHFNGRKHK